MKSGTKLQGEENFGEAVTFLELASDFKNSEVEWVLGTWEVGELTLETELHLLCTLLQATSLYSTMPDSYAGCIPVV